MKLKKIFAYIYPQFLRTEFFNKSIAQSIINDTAIINIFNSGNSNIGYIKKQNGQIMHALYTES